MYVEGLLPLIYVNIYLIEGDPTLENDELGVDDVGVTKAYSSW